MDCLLAYILHGMHEAMVQTINTDLVCWIHILMYGGTTYSNKYEVNIASCSTLKRYMERNERYWVFWQFFFKSHSHMCGSSMMYCLAFIMYGQLCAL